MAPGWLDLQVPGVCISRSPRSALSALTLPCDYTASSLAHLQARTEFLRRKARAALQSEAGGSQEVKDEEPGGALEHLNLFPIEESVEKKDNEEYLKEKKEETVGPLSQGCN